jgi:hypothetical protein
MLVDSDRHPSADLERGQQNEDEAPNEDESAQQNAPAGSFPSCVGVALIQSCLGFGLSYALYCLSCPNYVSTLAVWRCSLGLLLLGFVLCGVFIFVTIINLAPLCRGREVWIREVWIHPWLRALTIGGQNNDCGCHTMDGPGFA